ncbi:MAG TPA: protein-methionine-sulfoxide reductase catalytic subunit MsrP [Anaerolineales bacterium]|jgi:sulfoxide reductase catalytic subunit YedY|nr:protein-methionine-sulfoxide reductase catalytic subunit MsrP [Anaerolineales bacterium]
MDNKYKSVPILSSEITPKSQYLNRRDFLRAAGILTGSALLAACVPGSSGSGENPTQDPAFAAYVGKTDELGSPLNSYDDITHYNNFYEFSTNKEAVNPLSADFVSHPWSVEVSGLVNNPKTYAIEDLLSKFPQEDRIYRLRCVEAWSMVIPWRGFPLASLLKEVEPTSNAKYVRFETLMDSKQFPAENNTAFYPWPYHEGLRLDEAMNDLAILATGLYGEPLPAPDGAPIRLVVPWKYGFKSIKSIVKIELVEEQPTTFWKDIAPDEYGFYANVNPDVPHPRWLQNSERRIGELTRRATLFLNGYAEQVGYLYEGMDLKLSY